MKRILVVDDDVLVLGIVEKKLTEEGYEVWRAGDGSEALDLIRKRGIPHLAIVDVLMPGMGGFEFCEIVQEIADLPVVLLTAMEGEKAIVRGITYFAEDYITKPFNLQELAARVSRILRRIGDYDYALDPRIRIDRNLELDLAHQEARVGGKKVRLTPTENKILHILMTNAQRVVTTGYLLEHLWPGAEPDENMLRVHVHRLRQKIEKGQKSGQYIQTERGKGYRFAHAVDP